MKNDITYKIYNIFLGIFLFSLPVTEAVKQIALYITLIIGIYIIKSTNKKIELDAINLSIIGFVVFTFVSLVINGVSLGKISDPIACLLLFIVIRATADKIEIKPALYWLFAGFLVAFTMGCFAKFGSSNPSKLFELHSIGHVNHSAIFMVLIFIISFIYATSVNDKISRYICAIFALISLCGIIITGSRAAMYVMPIIIFMTLAYMVNQKTISIKTAFFTLVALSLVAFVIVYFATDPRIYKQISKGVVANETRFPLFLSAFYTWQDNPFFGIGSGNFKNINILQYFPNNLENYVPHAHNTFFTFLAEKGILALSSYVAFQVVLFCKFIKNMKQNAIVFLALCILVINNIISLANTTFHHENALLMIFFWALAVNYIDNKFSKNVETL
ncbi:MAG: O-antigen ligase family protein [Campylobacter sp.]